MLLNQDIVVKVRQRCAECHPLSNAQSSAS
jgi:hypothetical protein